MVFAADFSLEPPLEALERFIRSVRDPRSETGRRLVDRAVEEVFELTKAEQSRHRVEVRSRLAEKLPLVRFEPEQLRQVILNLAMNSLQAMEDGGIIEVATRSAGDRAQLAIRDSGRGIPDEIRDRLENLVQAVVDAGACPRPGGHIPPERFLCQS